MLLLMCTSVAKAGVLINTTFFGVAQTTPRPARDSLPHPCFLFTPEWIIGDLHQGNYYKSLDDFGH